MCERDLGILVDDHLNRSWQHVEDLQKAKVILGSINRDVVSKLQEVMVCSAAFCFSRLVYCVQFWMLQFKRHTDKLEWI